MQDGALFRRIWSPRRGAGDGGPLPCSAVGTAALDAGSVARIINHRAKVAGFDPATIDGHSLK